MKTCIWITCLSVLVAIVVAQEPGDGDRLNQGKMDTIHSEGCSVEACSTTDPLSQDVDGTTLCCDSSKYTSIRFKAVKDPDDPEASPLCVCDV